MVDSYTRDYFKLLWNVNKPRPDLVCELKNGDEVAYTEAKAH
jgi:hypothetical protein